MSIFKTHPNLLQTNSLCFILRTYIISRGCIKKFFSKTFFSIENIFSKKIVFPDFFEKKKRTFSKNENFEKLKDQTFENRKIFGFFKIFGKNLFFRKSFFDRKNIFSKNFSMEFFRNIIFVKPHSPAMPPALPGVM